MMISFLFAVMTSGWNSGYDFMTGLGMMNLIISVVGVFVGLIILITGNKETALNMFISSGLLLLTGIGVCSTFPMKF